MKKLMLIVIVGLGSVLTGCEPPHSSEFENVRDNNTWQPQGRGVKTKVVEIDGHKYIMMDGSGSGNIIHAESCGCKK